MIFIVLFLFLSLGLSNGAVDKSAVPKKYVMHGDKYLMTNGKQIALKTPYEDGFDWAIYLEVNQLVAKLELGKMYVKNVYSAREPALSYSWAPIPVFYDDGLIYYDQSSSDPNMYLSIDRKGNIAWKEAVHNGIGKWKHPDHSSGWTLVPSGSALGVYKHAHALKKLKILIDKNSVDFSEDLLSKLKAAGDLLVLNQLESSHLDQISSILNTIEARDLSQHLAPIINILGRHAGQEIKHFLLLALNHLGRLLLEYSAIKRSD
jgi:hypothetical protein